MGAVLADGNQCIHVQGVLSPGETSLVHMVLQKLLSGSELQVPAEVTRTLVCSFIVFSLSCLAFSILSLLLSGTTHLP